MTTQTLENLLGHKPPQSEMQRLLSLPRTEAELRPDLLTPQSEIVQKWTQKTRTSGGTWTLRPVQALALEWLQRYPRGLFGAIGVGRGKTGISLLVHHALNIEPNRVLLVLPAHMRRGLATEGHKYIPQFDINMQTHVASYAELSDPDKGYEIFETIRPQVIVCDEAHYLASQDSARTQRVLRFAQNYPDVRWVLLSGTMTSRSIREYAHLAELALRDASPLPRSWKAIEDLSVCCDVVSGAPPPASPWQWRETEKLVRAFHPDATQLPGIMDMGVAQRQKVCREALHQRLRTAPGVIQTLKDELGATLVIKPRSFAPVPGLMERTINEVQQTWVLPNEDEIDSPLEMARVLNQLSMGFYYRWVWPDDEPDVDWLRARRRQARAIRETIRKNAHRGIDSPTMAIRNLYALQNRPFTTAAQYKQADEELAREEWAELAAAREQWVAQSHKPRPPTEPVWYTDWFLEQVISIAEGTDGEENALVWYSHTAVADRLEQMGAPITVIRPGDPPPVKEQALPCAVSIRAHGTGTNLQGWGRSIVLSPPASGKIWEQLLGRLHREGQMRDEVTYEICTHTASNAKAVTRARQQATYIEQSMGQQQRLLYAVWLMENDSD